MNIFISHAFEDANRFDDFCLALEQKNVKYWDPKTMRGGTSLREQLRAAIDQCALCVFIASRKSVASRWCLAELGAFWGSGKKVIVYLADDSLAETELPKQFSGDIWFRRVREVVNEVVVTLEELSRNERIDQQIASSVTRVGEISVGTFIDLLRTGFSENGWKPPFSESMDRLYLMLAARIDRGRVSVTADFAASLQPYLMHLISESVESLKSFGKGGWPHRFGLETSSGKWSGFAADFSTYAGGDVEVYAGCVLIRISHDQIDSAVIVHSVSDIGVENPARRAIGGVIAAAGTNLPGTIQTITEFVIESNPPIVTQQVRS